MLVTGYRNALEASRNSIPIKRQIDLADSTYAEFTGSLDRRILHTRYIPHRNSLSTDIWDDSRDWAPVGRTTGPCRLDREAEWEAGAADHWRHNSAVISAARPRRDSRCGCRQSPRWTAGESLVEPARNWKSKTLLNWKQWSTGVDGVVVLY